MWTNPRVTPFPPKTIISLVFEMDRFRAGELKN
jgi:hypothetical protein